MAGLDEGGDAVWVGGEFEDELALVEGALSGEREEFEAQAFGASVADLDGEGEAFECGEEVGGEDVDADPCVVGGEDVAGQNASAEFVFEEAMDVFDGAGLLPVPAREFDRSQHMIGGDGKILMGQLPPADATARIDDLPTIARDWRCLRPLPAGARAIARSEARAEAHRGA